MLRISAGQRNDAPHPPHKGDPFRLAQGGPEWKRVWDKLPRRTRRTIFRSNLRGEPIADPSLAALAAGAAARHRRNLGSPRVQRNFYRVVGAVLILSSALQVASAVTAESVVRLGMAVLVLALAVLLVALPPRWIERRSKAEAPTEGRSGSSKVAEVGRRTLPAGAPRRSRCMEDALATRVGRPEEQCAQRLEGGPSDPADAGRHKTPLAVIRHSTGGPEGVESG